MAALPVIVDEDLPHRLAEMLVGRGYAADSVAGLRRDGTKDPQLWPRVQAAGALLITGDKEFGDLRLYPPGTHGGVLLPRPERDGVPSLLRLVDQVLAVCPLERLVGTIAVASERGIRIRRPPADGDELDRIPIL